MRALAVLDGTRGGAESGARALAALVAERTQADGADLAWESLVFYAEHRHRDDLVRQAPTSDVHLIRVAEPFSESMLATLVEEATAPGVALLAFPPGPTGTGLATRLALRARGSVCTDVLRVEVAEESAWCRRLVYGGHLIGRFELRARPWCITVDAGAGEPLPPAGGARRVVTDRDGVGAAGSSPLEDVDYTDLPATGDIQSARFLVVAGRGVGSRDGLRRVEAAAASLGAVVGVSRSVVMSGWAPFDRLIGVSGARSAPALCIVAGASGAPALMWGIEKAEHIVAVNTDADAPVFADADTVVLEDCVSFMEELAAAAGKGRGSASIDPEDAA